MPETTLSLREKLHSIADAIDNMAKTGRNENHHYDYVEAAQVIRKVREELLLKRIVMFPSARNVQHFAETGGKGFVTTVDLEYEFSDLDSAEKITIPWVGAGADVGGDKGLYKAYTGGLKYALLNFFMIPTGDDPERDQVSEQPKESKSKDAARSASPAIPLDRAKLILEAACACGLAKKSEESGTLEVTLMPVFKAKLAEAGVTTGKIADLNVDMAEDVEAFLKEEASRAGS